MKRIMVLKLFQEWLSNLESLLQIEAKIIRKLSQNVKVSEIS